jgi:hypothetical protein
MFLKCYHHLHPMIESIDEDCNLDIFQQTASISEGIIHFQTLPNGS